MPLMPSSTMLWMHCLAEARANAKPNVFFAARVDGMGKNGVMISLHKNYADYAGFIREVKIEREGIITDSDSLLISLKEFIAKQFSLKYLAELLEAHEGSEA